MAPSYVSSEDDPELVRAGGASPGVEGGEAVSMRRRRRTGTQIGDDGAEEDGPRPGLSGPASSDSASDSESDTEMRRLRCRVPSLENTGMTLIEPVVTTRLPVLARDVVPILAPGIDSVYPAPRYGKRAATMDLPLYVWHDATGRPERMEDAVVRVVPDKPAVFNHTGTKTDHRTGAIAVIGVTLAGTAGAGVDNTERWTRATPAKVDDKTVWTVRIGPVEGRGRIELVDAGPPSGTDGSRLSLVAFYTAGKAGTCSPATPPGDRLGDVNRPGRAGRDETQFPKLYQIDDAETRPYDGRRLAGTTIILGAVPVTLGRLPGIPERLPSEWMNRWEIAAEEGVVSVSAAIEGGTSSPNASGGFPTGERGGARGENRIRGAGWINRLRKLASAVVRAPPGSESLGSYVSDGVENRWALLARNIVAEPGKRVHGDCEDLAILAAAAIAQTEKEATQVGVAVVVVDKSGTRSPEELEADRTEYRRGVDYRNHMAVVETRGQTVALADATAETISWKWPGILVAIFDQSGICWCREPGGRLGVSFGADGILDSANIVRTTMIGSNQKFIRPN